MLIILLVYGMELGVMEEFTKMIYWSGWFEDVLLSVSFDFVERRQTVTVLDLDECVGC